MLQIEKASFSGWANCVRLSNDHVELIATTDVGPRILFFGRRGGANQLAVIPETAGLTGGDQWRLYGGHRLWNAPEHFPDSYYPDNGTVQLVEEKDFIRLIQPVETTTHIRKEIEIRLSSSEPAVDILHRLVNCADIPQKLAPWAITAFAAGGVGILPFSMDKDNPAPKPGLVFSAWDYTDLADPRLHWHSRCLLVRQDAGISRWLKVGLNSSLGTMAYLRGRDLFIKKYPVASGANYPDNGSTSECWTNDVYLELESLAPVQLVQPGGTAQHSENWSLLELDSPLHHTDELVEQVLPLLFAK
jgi:hypothetical protein